MAQAGTFFRVLDYVDPRSRVPVVAIVAQGATAAFVALSGTYIQILNYVESVDFVFFGLAAIALFITNALFLVVAWAIVLDVAISSPRDTPVGLGVISLGLPVYAVFAANRRRIATRGDLS
ncbi:MAG TPA: hypothetical protein VIK27_12845 [Candidatus Aquilonibacter sp.]